MHSSETTGVINLETAFVPHNSSETHNILPGDSVRRRKEEKGEKIKCLGYILRTERGDWERRSKRRIKSKIFTFPLITLGLKLFSQSIIVSAKKLTTRPSPLKASVFNIKRRRQDAHNLASFVIELIRIEMEKLSAQKTLESSEKECGEGVRQPSLVLFNQHFQLFVSFGTANLTRFVIVLS